MKLHSLTVAFLAVLFFASCKKENENLPNNNEGQIVEKSISKENAEAIQMLEEFYQFYLNEVSFAEDLKLSEKRLDSLKATHCTKELISSINADFENETLDYDPFIKAQDADPEMLKTLSVQYLKGSDNKYEVKYIDGYSKAEVAIVVDIVEENGKVKISALDYKDGL